MTHTKDEALELAKIWFERNTYGDEAVEVYEAIEQALAAPVREDWGPGPHEYHSLPAPVQEPVAWLYPEGLEALQSGKCWTAYPTKHDGCNIPLCVPSAAQPAVPLTRDELRAMWNNRNTCWDFYVGVDARLFGRFAAPEKGQP
jgi:hypothetical protein